MIDALTQKDALPESEQLLRGFKLSATGLLDVFDSFSRQSEATQEAMLKLLSEERTKAEQQGRFMHVRGLNLIETLIHEQSTVGELVDKNVAKMNSEA